MSEIGSTSTAFRLDSVNWDRAEDSATLHLSGRWRRRPIGAVQPVLVIERAGTRHRFPARPEPPGLAGLAPGATRISFDVPAEMAPEPGDHLWLGLGSVLVSLPGAGSRTGEDLAEGRGEPGPEPERRPSPVRSRDPSARAERMALEAELAVLRAALAAVEAEPGEELRARVRGLEGERRELERRLSEAETALAAARSVPVSAPGPSRLAPVLDAIGEELAALRAGLERERSARSEAETRAEAAEAELAASRRRAGDAYAALERLRTELMGASPPATLTPMLEAPVTVSVTPSPPPAGAPADLDPSRFDAARSRLRTVPVDSTPASDWLARALRSLARADPEAAGQLALALLPAQALGTGAVRYDLVLADGGTLLVDVPGARQPVLVRAGEQPRAPSEVDFSFHGTVAALGRLVAAGRLPGRIRRTRGQIAGSRDAAGVLAALGGHRVRLAALLAAGLALDGQQALALAAHAIDPELTRGERWTIAFAEPERAASRLLLTIRDGARPAVLRAPISAPAEAEIRVAESEIAALLAALPGAAAAVSGDPRGLDRIRAWLLSAQSG
jgi:hypothetical protein